MKIQLFAAIISPDPPMLYTQIPGTDTGGLQRDVYSDQLGNTFHSGIVVESPVVYESPEKKRGT